jgi:hypothetical protein
MAIQAENGIKWLSENGEAHDLKTRSSIIGHDRGEHPSRIDFIFSCVKAE